MMKPVPRAVCLDGRSGRRPPPPRGPKKKSNGSTPSGEKRALTWVVVVMLTTVGFTCSASAATSNVAGTGGGGVDVADASCKGCADGDVATAIGGAGTSGEAICVLGDELCPQPAIKA